MPENCPPNDIGADDGVQVDLRDANGIEIQRYAQIHGLSDVADPICQYGINLVTMNAFIHQLIDRHFADPQLILSDMAKTLVGRVLVAPFASFKADTAGKLPAVIYARSQMVCESFLTDDAVPGGCTDPKLAAMLGIGHFARKVTGGYQLSCAAETVGEAETLAYEVFEILTMLSPVIRARLPFLAFLTSGIGQVAPLDALGLQISVPVQLTYVHSYQWALREMAPRLRSVTIT